LTPAGESYLEHAKNALLELTAGEEKLIALRSDLNGKIRVTAPVSWGQRMLSKKIPEFLRIHPGIEIELVLSDRMMDLSHDKFDVAFRWSSSIGSKEMLSRRVADIQWFLVSSPQYLAAHKTPSSPNELVRHSCLFYWREPTDDWWILENEGETVRVKVNGRFHVDNPEAVLEGCIQGMGIALLPNYLCFDALDQEKLVRVLPNWVPKTRFGDNITAMIAPERMRIIRNKTFFEFAANGI
jgi:DNA-binding transcriptional LysR family regulator